MEKRRQDASWSTHGTTYAKRYVRTALPLDSQRVLKYIRSWRAMESQSPMRKYDDSLNVLPKIVKFTQQSSFTELLSCSYPPPSHVSLLTAEVLHYLTCRLTQSVPALKMPEGKHILYPINHIYWHWPKWSCFFWESPASSKYGCFFYLYITYKQIYDRK